MIDLHCHSTFSDGALNPEDLIQKALDHQIQCLSLTDHDTIAGYDLLYLAAVSSSIKIISGIELSTRWKKYDIHMLGYCMEHTSDLMEVIEQQSQSRIIRAQEIGVALKSAGVSDAYEKARELAGHERVGRPHFARVLVSEKKANDMATAFRRFLVRGKSAYVPTQWISIQQAVEVIAKSGGKAVIAHPLKYGLTRTKLHELIGEFRDVGGEGIEVVSGEMTNAQINEMAGLSIRFNLLASSGSDYHGDKQSRIGLGRQKNLPPHCTPIWKEWNI